MQKNIHRCLHQIIHRYQEWQKHRRHCMHHKTCSNFRADNPYCTNFKGEGCGLWAITIKEAGPPRNER